MRTLLVIGVGVGDPEFVTVQAITALNAVDVFFVFGKPAAAGELDEARRRIRERYIREPRYRVVEIPDPPRDRRAARNRGYRAAVDDWRDQRARLLEQVIAAELVDGGCGGILVWGDPSLYDGTIRVIDTIRERGALELDHRVIPGISSIHALAARHRIPLNRVAGPVQVTTGRLLAEGLPGDVDDVVVMLDSADSTLSCASLRDHPFDIYWGACLGTEDETLISGPLRDVIDEIERTRTLLKRRKGWIMDAYLLRRGPGHPDRAVPPRVEDGAPGEPAGRSRMESRLWAMARRIRFRCAEGMTDVVGPDRTAPVMGSAVEMLTTVALLGSGLAAGTFLAFSSFVMPALARMPADRGMAAMQSMNITAMRPAFMSVLFGTALLCLVLAVLGFRALGTPYGRWLLVGALLYLAGAIVLTIVFHVPLNDELAALDPARPDSAAVWTRYLSRWGAANQLRWICPLGATAAFVLALRRS